MRRLLLLAALVLGVLAPSVRAQITITRADLESIYNTTSTSSSFSTDESPATLAVLQALAGQTGGGQTWTFTGLPYTLDGSYTSTPVSAPQPGSDDPHLAQGDRIFRADSAGTTDQPVYSYVRLTDDALTNYGAAFVFEGTLQKTKFIPGIVQPLPYTFGSSWVNEYDLVLDPEPVPIDQSTRDESEVVGWGTLVTPAGSADALMVRSLIISRSEIVIPGLPPIVTIDSTRFVAFVTEGRTGASVFLNEAGEALGGGYSSAAGPISAADDPSEGRLALTVGPNPVRSGSVAVRFSLPEAGAATAVVVDALGRDVAVLADGPQAAGERTLTWDASAAPAGIYVVRLQSGAATAVRRVVVVR